MDTKVHEAGRLRVEPRSGNLAGTPCDESSEIIRRIENNKVRETAEIKKVLTVVGPFLLGALCRDWDLG